MSEEYGIEDQFEGSNATTGLIPQAQIMEVLHNLNVSELIIPKHGYRCEKESSMKRI